MPETSASRAWTTKLFGPVPAKAPAGTAGGMAGYDRWKRLTTAEHIGEHLWGRRQELRDAIPAPTDPAEHTPLVLPDDEGFHGTCAANGCRYLGPYRNTETAARGDAKRHATQRNRAARPKV